MRCPTLFEHISQQHYLASESRLSSVDNHAAIAHFNFEALQLTSDGLYNTNPPLTVLEDI